MNILIITGGLSSERNISLISAKQVKEALGKNGHKVRVYDFKNDYVSLKRAVPNVDVFFPVLHGEEGEGGTLHKFLSGLDKPIVGTRNYKALQKGWHKIPFKKFCDQNEIPTAPWKIIKNRKDILNFGFPSVLKSSSGGSSREVIILWSREDSRKYSCKKLLNTSGLIFVERYLSGIEVTVGILDKNALPLVEIIPPRGEWFNYRNKYSGGTQEIPFAPSLDRIIYYKTQKMALKIHQTLGLGTYSRIDFIVSKNVPYVLEVNMIPGLTAKSLFPKAAQAVGISFPQLTEKLVKLALSATPPAGD